MLTMTWNSLLLSKGSIFTSTIFSGTSEQATSKQQHHHAEEDTTRLRAAVDERRHHAPVRRIGQSSLAPAVVRAVPMPRSSRRSAAHGETMNATSSEKSMAADAPTGIGRMYGPINPRTKAIGRIAAITAKVARMVGLPTSATASTATSLSGPALVLRHAEVPHHVLHDDDGVVDQDADAEDEREQRHAVERVAER